MTPAAAPGATCPSCGQVLEPGARYCDSCGFQLGEVAAVQDEPAAEEKKNLWLPLLMIAWLIIMVAALWFVYGSAITLGST